MAVRHLEAHRVGGVAVVARYRRHRLVRDAALRGCGRTHRQVAGPCEGVVPRGGLIHRARELVSARVRAQLGDSRDARARDGINRHRGLAPRHAVRGLVRGRHRHRIGACVGIAQVHLVRAGTAVHRGVRRGPRVGVVAGRACRGDGHRVVVQRGGGAHRGRGRKVRQQGVVHRNRETLAVSWTRLAVVRVGRGHCDGTAYRGGRAIGGCEGSQWATGAIGTETDGRVVVRPSIAHSSRTRGIRTEGHGIGLGTRADRLVRDGVLCDGRVHRDSERLSWAIACYSAVVEVRGHRDGGRNRGSA